jgi:hypothetical protein
VSAGVHRENQASKIEDFFDQNDGLIQEMMHRDSLADNLFLNNLSQGETFLKNLSFAFTIIINLLIVWCGSLNPCLSLSLSLAIISYNYDCLAVGAGRSRRPSSWWTVKRRRAQSCTSTSSTPPSSP